MNTTINNYLFNFMNLARLGEVDQLIFWRMTDRGKRFEQLEEHIESVIDHCREAGIIVCDYQPGVAFHKKINDLVLKLQVGCQIMGILYIYIYIYHCYFHQGYT